MLLNLDGTVMEQMGAEDALRHVEGVAGALERLGESADWSNAHDAAMLGTFAAILHDAAAALAVELNTAQLEGTRAR